MATIRFSLSFFGALADDNGIDFYDVGQALIGFQRSLAITTHAVLNDEVIVHAPALKGAQIIALPPEQGSWKISALVVSGVIAAHQLGTVPRDTPLGNLISSSYDYVVSESLGFHVDYAKTLGEQYDELHSATAGGGSSFQSRLDSVIEKVERAIVEMHRPIVKSMTAELAKIQSNVGRQDKDIGHDLNRDTYAYISYTDTTSSQEEFIGRISSYNINTFKGRVFVSENGRPVPFELSESCKDFQSVRLVTGSLTANAQDRLDGSGTIRFNALKNLSRSGQLKGYYITAIGAGPRT